MEEKHNQNLINLELLIFPRQGAKIKGCHIELVKFREKCITQ